MLQRFEIWDAGLMFYGFEERIWVGGTARLNKLINNGTNILIATLMAGAKPTERLELWSSLDIQSVNFGPSFEFGVRYRLGDLRKIVNN